MSHAGEFNSNGVIQIPMVQSPSIFAEGILRFERRGYSFRGLWHVNTLAPLPSSLLSFLFSFDAELAAARRRLQVQIRVF